VTSEVAARPANQLSVKQLQYVQNADFIPKNMRGNMPAILACVASGRELGLGDMESLRSLYIVDGKATLSAELMTRLIRRAGHSLTGSTSPDTATAAGRRADNGDEMSVTWTLAMAERAGLHRKDNWRKYPESMLWARAVSQLARMLFADVLGGLVYTPEELGDDNIPDATIVSVNTETGEILEITESGDVTVTAPAEFEGAPTTPITPEEDALPYPQPEPEPQPGTPEPIDKQRRRMFATMRDLGLGEHLDEPGKRKLRLAYVSKISRRPVGSSTDLTQGEISAVLAALDQDKRMLAAGHKTLIDEVEESLNIHYNEFPDGFG